MNDYCRTTSVTCLLNQFEWSYLVIWSYQHLCSSAYGTLQICLWLWLWYLSVRQRNSRLVAFYKAINNLSPVPVGQLRPCSHQTRSYDPLIFTPLTPRTDYYNYSLSLTIVDWNSLPFSLRAKPSVASFCAGLQHLTVSSLYIISLSRTTTLQQ